jgi:hypothetical protein
MSNVKEVRAQLRGETERPRERGGSLTLLIYGICGLAAGYLLFLFGTQTLQSRLPIQPSADLPTYEQVRQRLELAQKGTTGASVVSPPSNAALYTRMTADEMGAAADMVCFQRAHASHPSGSKTPRLTTKTFDEFQTELNHFNELMYCLITEAPMRYCTAVQRNMINSEIAHYFRALFYLNSQADQFGNSTLPGRQASDQKIDPSRVIPDPRVIAAIEARLRDGLFTRNDRDWIGASAPEAIRARFTRIEPPDPPCPRPAWWAIWQ